jgi:Pyruvate/2-oxoacid:ferredoxin oxidoreductase delta subunit
VAIGGKTFTFGLGANPTTDVYNGQTISIGHNGVGFKTTTFTGATATSTSSKKKELGGWDAIQKILRSSWDLHCGWCWVFAVKSRWGVGVLVCVNHLFEYTQGLDACDNESMTVRIIFYDR